MLPHSTGCSRGSGYHFPGVRRKQEPSSTPHSSAKLTLVEMTADLHGWLPLAILTRQVLVITLQHVAFSTQVLDDAARVQGVSTGPGVADVATILWLRGQGTHCKDRESRGTVVRFSSETAVSDKEGAALRASAGNTPGAKSQPLGKAAGQTLQVQVANDRGRRPGNRGSLAACSTSPRPPSPALRLRTTASITEQ